MKKFNILLFFSLCYSFSQAQISFTRTDMPSVGWINPEQEDTTRNRVAAISFGRKGAHQIYDFTSLQENILDSVYYLALTNSQHTAVPNANLSVFVPPTTYLFAEDTTNSYAYTGLQATVFNTVVISKYTSPDSIYKFPLGFAQTIKGNYGGSIKLLATTVNSNLSLLGWDSIKVAITASYTDTIDGWGIVKTPVGTYKCLRQKRVEIDTTTYYYNTSNGGAYTLMPTTILGTQVLAANPAYAVTTSYSYLAKEAKGPVISFTYDSISQPITGNWTTMPATLAANFGSDTGSAGLVTFSDSSTGPNALTYSWNFGDGSNPSTSANPTHTYAANGTYYVCETVSHGGSSNTYCDSVHVTNVAVGAPPVASITPAGIDSICPGTSVILRAQTSAGYTFKWSTGATADSIIVSNAGSYTVKVYHTGDSATSAPTVVVIDAPNTSLTLTGPASFCIGDSTKITAAAGQTYHWSNNAVTQSIWVSTSGNYTVTVTNSKQCTAVSSPQVMTANNPQLDTITQSGHVLTSKTESSYQWYEGSTLLTGATLMTYTPTSNGTYTVHFTDGNGCTSVSNSITVTGAGINEINPSDYRIYPNPASEVIQLDLSHIDQNTLNELSQVVVFNLLGEQVKSLPISQTTISVKDLSNGTYLIGVMDKNQSRKILGKFDVLK